LVNGPTFHDGAAQLPDRYQRHKPHLALRRLCQRRYYTAGLDGNLHLRTGESHANADGDSNGNAHSDSYAYGHSNSYAYADSYANGHGNGNAHTDSYANGDVDTNTNNPAENNSDTKASAHTAAAAIVRLGIVL
jgi:hypothetical protein